MLDRWAGICYSIKIRAISSAGEHCLHTAGVAGSNPASPTTFYDRPVMQYLACFFNTDVN